MSCNDAENNYGSSDDHLCSEAWPSLLLMLSPLEG